MPISMRQQGSLPAERLRHHTTDSIIDGTDVLIPKPRAYLNRGVYNLTDDTGVDQMLSYHAKGYPLQAPPYLIEGWTCAPLLLPMRECK